MPCSCTLTLTLPCSKDSSQSDLNTYLNRTALHRGKWWVVYTWFFLLLLSQTVTYSVFTIIMDVGGSSRKMMLYLPFLATQWCWQVPRPEWRLSYWPDWRKSIDNTTFLTNTTTGRFDQQPTSGPNYSENSVVPFTLRFACRDPAPIPRLLLCVKASDMARGEISLWHWFASGGSIRAVLLANRTSVNE